MADLFPDREKHAVEKAMDILAILKACAAAGSVCPSNDALAGRVGYRSSSGPSEAISFLATCGFITVERTNHTRIVTICATGKRTADPRICKTKAPRKPHHSAQINALGAVA